MIAGVSLTDFVLALVGGGGGGLSAPPGCVGLLIRDESAGISTVEFANDFGGPLVPAYVGNTAATLTLAGAFPAGRTWVSFSPGMVGGVYGSASWWRVNSDVLKFAFLRSRASMDEPEVSSFEICVYPA